MHTASVVRNKQHLLVNLDLTIETGEMVVIAGENGAGKTTLLRVIAGLMSITEGEAAVFGDALPLNSRTRRRISAALDEPAFWPWMSAHAVVKTTADLSGRPRPDIPHLLGELGLDHVRFALRRSKRVGNFSQGMRKRLQVACALALPADLLLLDEPTASLDAEGAELVWAALERRRHEGATVVIATHDERAVDRLQARRITLDRGRLLSDTGIPLLAAPR